MKSRLEQKLDDLVIFHEELVEDLPKENLFYSERVIRRGVEKTIQLIGDTLIDVAMMIISQEGFEKPKDSREAIAVLEKNKILTKKVSLQIQDFISFRNLLVHRYGKVNEKQEYDNISENHTDVLDFVREVKLFIKKH